MSNDAHGDLASLSTPTLQALCAALALANTLGLHADDCDTLTPAERQARAELLTEDLRDCAAALAEAARLLSIDDPLGCVDSSEAYAELSEARAVYHAALAGLGVDPPPVASPPPARDTERCAPPESGQWVIPPRRSAALLADWSEAERADTTPAPAPEAWS